MTYLEEIMMMLSFEYNTNDFLKESIAIYAAVPFFDQVIYEFNLNEKGLCERFLSAIMYNGWFPMAFNNQLILKFDHERCCLFLKVLFFIF